LGYIVNAGLTRQEDRLFFSYFVQSPSHTASDIQQRINHYQHTRLGEKLNMDEHTFKQLKDSVLSDYLTPLRQVGQGAHRLWYLAFERNEEFNRADNYLQELQDLTYTQFQQEINTFAKQQTSWPQLALHAQSQDKK